MAVDLLLEAHCPRPQALALALATKWLRAPASPRLIGVLITAVVPTRYDTAAELARHGSTAGDLERRLDGVPARRRLRHGEPVGQVVARLLACQQPRRPQFQAWAHSLGVGPRPLHLPVLTHHLEEP